MAGKADGASATVSLNFESNGKQVGESTAAALERMRDAMFEDIDAIKGMQAAMRNLKGGGKDTADSVKALKEHINTNRAAVAKSQMAYLQLGGSFKDLKPKAKEATAAVKGSTQSLQEVLGAVQSAGGPIGSLAGRVSNLAAKIGGGSTVTGLFRVAIIGLAAAATAAVGAMTKFGIAVADARRSETLALEAANKLRVGLFFLGDGLVRARDSGAFVQQQIDKISTSFDIGREQAIGFANDLQTMGMRGGNLQVALEGLAIAQQTQGEAGVAQFKAMISHARMFGGSVQKVADDFKARLGPIAKAQMLSLGAQWRTLQKGITTIFSGLKLDKFLEQISKVTELFTQSTASGESLKKTVEWIFQPIIDFLGDHASDVRNFFEGMQIATLTLILWVVKLRNVLRDAIGDWLPEQLNTNEVAFQAGIKVVQLLAAAMGVLAINTLIAIGPWLAFGALMIAGGYAIGYIKNNIKEFGDSLDYLAGKAGEWATNIIDGIVNGITAGVQRVKDAVTKLAIGARDTFKGILGIHSPSVVFKNAGVNVAEGAEQGIRAGTPDVARAAAEMAPSGESMSGGKAAVSASGSAGGAVYNFNAVFNMGEGGNDSQKTDLESQVRRWVTDAIMGAAMQLGTGTP